MINYTLIISDAHRKILMAALHDLAFSSTALTDAQIEEMEILHDMLKDMDADSINNFLL